MRSTQFAIILSLIILLYACATSICCKNDRGEYTVTRLDSNQAQVSFYTRESSACAIDQTDLIYSCAQVTTEAGYDYFVIIGGNTDLRLKFAPLKPSVQEIPEYPLQGTKRVRLYAGTVFIKMFKGPKPPSLWYAYDARALTQF